MTPEMNWSNFEIDLSKPICMFDISKDEELKDAFNWKRLNHFQSQIISKREVKINIFWNIV